MCRDAFSPLTCHFAVWSEQTSPEPAGIIDRISAICGVGSLKLRRSLSLPKQTTQINIQHMELIPQSFLYNFSIKSLLYRDRDLIEVL